MTTPPDQVDALIQVKNKTLTPKYAIARQDLKNFHLTDGGR